MTAVNAKRICLIRTSAIGDTVHALGLVNGLRKGYPDAHLTWILQSVSFDMVKHQPNVDQFITFERKADFSAWRRLLIRLRQDRYDLALIPQVSAKVGLITMFIRARVKFGFDFRRSRELHWLVTNRKIPTRPMGHAQDQFFEFLDDLGITDYPVEWNFVFTPEEISWQKTFFRQLRRPVIGLVIASANKEKDWRPEGYARVIDYVDRVIDMEPMIIGGPSAREAEIADKICRLCRAKPTVALEKPIRKTMLQIAGSHMIIAPDTGPLHIAVALNVPTIGLYGYSDPRRCGPYRRFADLLIDKYNKPGNTDTPVTRRTRPDRMNLITPEEVIEKINLGLHTYGIKK
ncbi:MAG: lipopolysaccharide heptosyltransferase family protein [Desulfobacteraceae bacterium]|jgi:heptosyltransferase I|nr:MAG: lipopolysaccharide heptosyltransferase family protein [Desulfobacteraceae bacterium]